LRITDEFLTEKVQTAQPEHPSTNRYAWASYHICKEKFPGIFLERT
jgi:hypothetical protein